MPTEDGLTLVGLDEVGRARFVSVLLEVSQGDPGSESTRDSADAGFQELVDLAGLGFRPTDWYLVRRDHQDVGVLLPQIRWAAPDEGTILYMGVTPQARGHGLGRAIHAVGLRTGAPRCAPLCGRHGCWKCRDDRRLHGQRLLRHPSLSLNPARCWHRGGVRGGIANLPRGHGPASMAPECG